MKIPETSANVGAYYGNEENGQWQANGVMIDSGVGGGVVGSGDAGYVHHGPPVYPIRPHMSAPGYVMAGAYYPAAPGPGYPGAVLGPPHPGHPHPGHAHPGHGHPGHGHPGHGHPGHTHPGAPHDDFADYMWMENEDEFDKQVMQQLEEEALMEQCIEAMLEDERERDRNNRPVANGHAHYATTSNGASVISLEQVSKSTLNPLAAEFVPTFARTPPVSNPPDTSAESKEKSEAPTQEEKADSTSEPIPVEQCDSPNDTTTAIEPKPDTPEVSAADVQPIAEEKIVRSEKKLVKDPKKSVKPEPKKPVKIEPKAKAKPAPKPETKPAPKKKELKVKEEKEDSLEVVEAAPPSEPIKIEPLPVETVEPQCTAPKPINYAAAARANKPKPKATTPPTTTLEKPIASKLTSQSSRTDKPQSKTAERSISSRKNSTK